MVSVRTGDRAGGEGISFEKKSVVTVQDRWATFGNVGGGRRSMQGSKKAGKSQISLYQREEERLKSCPKSGKGPSETVTIK